MHKTLTSTLGAFALALTGLGLAAPLIATAAPPPPEAFFRDEDIVDAEVVDGLVYALGWLFWAARTPATPPNPDAAHGFGRELFTHLRRHATGAEQGACTW